MRLIPLILTVFSLHATADEYCTTPNPVMSLLRYCQDSTGTKLPPALTFVQSVNGGSGPNHCYNSLVQFDSANNRVSVLKTDRDGRLWSYRYSNANSSKEVCLSEGYGEEYRTTSPSVESGIIAGFSNSNNRYLGITTSSSSVSKDCKSQTTLRDPMKEAVAEDNSGFKMALAAFKSGIVNTARAAQTGTKLPMNYDNCVTMFEDYYKRKNQEVPFDDNERAIIANAIGGGPSIDQILKDQDGGASSDGH